LFVTLLRLLPDFIADRISPIRPVVRQLAVQMEMSDGVSMLLDRDSGQLHFFLNKARWPYLTFDGAPLGQVTLILDRLEARFIHIFFTGSGSEEVAVAELGWNEARFLARAAIKWLGVAPVGSVGVSQ
jgi:hypothetical protein